MMMLMTVIEYKMMVLCTKKSIVTVISWLLSLALLVHAVDLQWLKSFPELIISVVFLV